MASVKFVLPVVFLIFNLDVTSSAGQFSCNNQDVVFIFDVKSDYRLLDDWKALANDFIDKFNMLADSNDTYARFSAIQFGEDTRSTSATSGPTTVDDSIVFDLDTYVARNDVRLALDNGIASYRAYQTSIADALVHATTVLNLAQPANGDRQRIVIIFTDGLAGYNDQSEAQSQAEILRNILGVNIWAVLARDIISYDFEDAYSFGRILTNFVSYRLYNSTSQALLNNAMFSAYSNDYPCSTTPTPIFEPCPCFVNTSWNDVMILADSSDSITLNGLNEMWGFIVSALGTMTIGQAIQYQTRVGVITYANNATLFARLNQYQSSSQLLSDLWPYKNEPYTNIVDAVIMAQNEFEKNGRPKSRDVIIIGASTYRDGSYDLPLNKLETFKLNGGIVIVIGYGEIAAQTSELFQQMATPGFYIDATQGAPDFSILQKLLCNANCFCPGQWSDSGYYAVGNSSNDWPQQGCFWDSTLTAIKIVANSICQTTQAAPGTLAQPKLSIQQRAIIEHNTNQSPAKPPFFIDLQRSNGAWWWGDGTIYDSSVSGQLIDVGGDCAVVQQQNGFNVNTQSQNCNQGAYYACQTQPCSSANYCN